jgi:hypothetical protein
VRVAIGLRARTGSATLVAVGGELASPQVIESSSIPLLPEGAFAPYHAAEELEPKAADASVKRDIADAHRMAQEGIRGAVRRLTDAGHKVAGCGVLVGKGLPAWSTREIIAVHVRMHQAEGVLFREVLVAGVRACGLRLTTLPDKSALDAAARALRIDPRGLDELLALLGRSSKPWRKEQKEAAAAALAALADGI